MFLDEEKYRQNLRGTRIRIYQSRWIRNEVIKLPLRESLSLSARFLRGLEETFVISSSDKTNVKRREVFTDHLTRYIFRKRVLLLFPFLFRLAERSFQINTGINFLTNSDDVARLIFTMRFQKRSKTISLFRRRFAVRCS